MLTIKELAKITFTSPSSFIRIAHQMSRIQKEVHIYELQSEIVFNAALARTDSCALIISYSSETELLIQCIKVLKAHHIPVISLTNIGKV